MDLVIKIPKEFEEEFNRDKFEDSLSRVASDIESFGFQLAGRYELETITMLRDAFGNGTPVPKCNECKYYEGVHRVQGHAPCSYHTIGGVMWDWYCSQFEAVKESEE